MLTPILAAAADAVVTAGNTVQNVGMTGSLHIGLAAVGSAIGVGIIGMKAAEATGRNPGAAGVRQFRESVYDAIRAQRLTSARVQPFSGKTT